MNYFWQVGPRWLLCFAMLLAVCVLPACVAPQPDLPYTVLDRYALGGTIPPDPGRDDFFVITSEKEIDPPRMDIGGLQLDLRDAKLVHAVDLSNNLVLVIYRIGVDGTLIDHLQIKRANSTVEIGRAHV